MAERRRFGLSADMPAIGVLGRLSAPEAVQDEVFRKSRQDERFRAAAVVWRKLTPNWMQVLPDDHTPELAAVVHRMTRRPLEERLQRRKDLGEIMVIAHAVVAAEAGETVTILIDDGPGARTATAEINRLRRTQTTGRSIGSINLVSTLDPSGTETEALFETASRLAPFLGATLQAAR
jgi:hypothetical protein